MAQQQRPLTIDNITYELSARGQSMPGRYTWLWVCGSCKYSAAIAGAATSIDDALAKASAAVEAHHAEKHGSK